MEYRNHSKTNIKLSSLGINSNTWKYFKKENKQEKIYSILSTAYEHKINFFHLYQDSMNYFFNWLSQINTPSDLKLSLEFIFNDKLHLDIKELTNSNLISKLDLVTISDIPRHNKFTVELINGLQLLKEQNVITSIGAYSPYINEAILIAKSYDLDHLIVNLSLITSADLIKTLLTTCNNKNISLICTKPFSNGFLTSRIHNKEFCNIYKRNLSISSISDLIIEGKSKISSKLQEKSQTWKASLQHIALRYLLDMDISSILMGVNSPEEVIDNLKALLLPPLNHKQLLDIHNTNDFENYFKSPKHGNKISN